MVLFYQGETVRDWKQFLKKIIERHLGVWCRNNIRGTVKCKTRGTK